ncbi:MAG: GlsB/YeaQ/YmgE family stress response membrane protein [Dehalogenimonas sp.]
MGWFEHVLFGILIGIVARLVAPGKENMSWFVTILIGAAGSVVAALIGQATGLYGVPSWAGFIVAVILAVVLIVLYGGLVKKSR